MALRRLLMRTSRTSSSGPSSPRHAAARTSSSSSSSSNNKNVVLLGSGLPSSSAHSAAAPRTSSAATAPASNTMTTAATGAGAGAGGGERHVSVMRSWFFYILVPTAVVTWKFTRHAATTAVATVFVPVLAISQGAWGILRYRLHFGDAPLPKTPSHGVVQVTTTTTTTTDEKEEKEEEDKMKSVSLQPRHGSNESDVTTRHGQTSADEPNEKVSSPDKTNNGTLPPLRILVIGDSLAIGVGQGRRSTPVMPEVIAKTLSRQLDGRTVYWTCHGRPGASTGWILRELERGVAYLRQQASKHLDHEDDEDDEDYDDHIDDDHELEESLQLATTATTKRISSSSNGSSVTEADDSEEDSSSGSSSRSSEDGDDSSSSSDGGAATGLKPSGSSNSDVSSLDDEPQPLKQKDEKHRRRKKKHLKTKKSLKVWRQRLAQHGERFDQTPTSEFLSQYDIAIVLTGSNDLKSAFFPFLLKGEDVEFRRQAVERANGDSNNNYFLLELRLLFETLNQKMQIRVETWRESLLSATDNLASRVEQSIERIAPETSRRITQLRTELSSTAAAKREAFLRGTSSESQASRPSGRLEAVSKEGENEDKEHEDDTRDYHPHSLVQGRQRFPLVVLPGLPARALPIFQTVPLRWLAVPIVDNLDTHKMTLAKSHPGQVLFVPAPTVQQLALYERHQGDIYEAKQTEREILNVRDIKSRDSRRIRTEMQNYYHDKERRMGMRSRTPNLATEGSSILYNYIHAHPDDDDDNNSHNGKKDDGSPKGRRRPSNSSATGSGLFSVDQIHPRDQGYDFWGRHIGNAISQEWKKQHL